MFSSLHLDNRSTSIPSTQITSLLSFSHYTANHSDCFQTLVQNFTSIFSKIRILYHSVLPITITSITMVTVSTQPFPFSSAQSAHVETIGYTSGKISRGKQIPFPPTEQSPPEKKLFHDIYCTSYCKYHWNIARVIFSSAQGYIATSCFKVILLYRKKNHS